MRPRLPAVRHICLLLAAVLGMISALLLVFPTAKTQAAAPESLTISARMGIGGKVVTLKTYSIADLTAVGTRDETYTVIDALPSVVVAAVRGVYLKTLFADVGVDTSEIQSVYCHATDGKTNNFSNYELFVQTRYRYDSLQNHYVNDQVYDMDDWDSIKAQVQPMLSLSEKWTRASDGGEVNQGGKYDELDTQRTLRIFTGMVDLSQMASTQTYWIDSIVLTLSYSVSEFSLGISGNRTNSLVGDTYNLEIDVQNAGVFENQIRSDVQWSSSNENVAKVDSYGNVTIVGEGEATIYARSDAFDLDASAKVGTRDATPDPNNNGGNENTGGEEDPGDEKDPIEPEAPPTPVIIPDIYGGGGTGGGSGSGSLGGMLGTVAGKIFSFLSDSAGTVPAGYVPVDLDLNNVIDFGGGTSDGGQKQRGYAVELGNGAAAGILLETDDSNPLLTFTGVAAGILFILGGLGRGLKYIKDIGGIYVLRRKSI